MNLVYTLSVKKDTVIHTFLKNHWIHDFSTESKKSLAKVVSRATYRDSKDVQEPNPRNRILNGTAGLPKGRKPYGNGVLIAGRAYSTEGGQVPSCMQRKEIIIPTPPMEGGFGCDHLESIRNRNEKTSHAKFFYEC